VLKEFGNVGCTYLRRELLEIPFPHGTSPDGVLRPSQIGYGTSVSWDQVISVSPKKGIRPIIFLTPFLGTLHFLRLRGFSLRNELNGMIACSMLPDFSGQRFPSFRYDPPRDLEALLFFLQISREIVSCFVALCFSDCPPPPDEYASGASGVLTMTFFFHFASFHFSLPLRCSRRVLSRFSFGSALGNRLLKP